MAARHWAEAALVFAALIPLAAYRLTTALLEIEPERRATLATAYGLAFANIMLVLGGAGFVEEMVYTSSRWHPLLDPWRQSVFAATWTTLLAMSVVEWVWAYRDAASPRDNR